jgi:hypothetical protein
MARLAAIIPPPRFPLVRFHGVLGPRSSWRKDIVPRPPGPTHCPRDTNKPAPRGTRRGRGDNRTTPRTDRSATDPLDKSAPHATTTIATHSSIARTPHDGTTTETPAVPAVATLPLQPDAPTLLAPNVLSVTHWNRLAGGDLYAATPRMAWAPLLRRTFAVDVQECPKCHGRLRLVAAIVDPSVARAILSNLGMPTSAPAAARARDPTDLFDLEPLDAHPT